MHTGVGFYGRDAADGGSRNVHISGFTISGDVRERIGTDQVNAIGGALSDSTIDGLYLQHTKMGVWLDGPMRNVRVTDNIIVDQIADALNFHTGVTDSVVPNNFVRNTGDDGLAMWSEGIADARNTFTRNTVQSPVLANGIAIDGGTDNTVSHVHFRDIRVDGTGASVVSARTAGSASFANVDARNVGAVGVHNCGSFRFTPGGSEFSLTDLGANDDGGWLGPWLLPNTITCADRPPVVPPPPPSHW